MAERAAQPRPRGGGGTEVGEGERADEGGRDDLAEVAGERQRGGTQPQLVADVGHSGVTDPHVEGGAPKLAAGDELGREQVSARVAHQEADEDFHLDFLPGYQSPSVPLPMG